MPGYGVPWTEEEDRILRENYQKMGMKTSALLPRRTPGAVTSRASKLGLHTFSFDNEARGRKVAEQLERQRYLTLVRPKHCWNSEEFSRDWYVKQDRAFREAMEANPEERPIDYIIPRNYAAA